MILEEQAPVPLAELPVTEFRAHLKLGTGFSDDAAQDSVLEPILRSALAAIEARTSKVILARSFCWKLVSWRGVLKEEFPVAPVNAITQLRIMEPGGGVQVIAPERYRLERDDLVSALRAADGSGGRWDRGGFRCRDGCDVGGDSGGYRPGGAAAGGTIPRRSPCDRGRNEADPQRDREPSCPVPRDATVRRKSVMGVIQLTRRLTLEEAQSTPDGSGGFAQSWIALGVRWADMRHGSGRERAAEFATVSSVPYRITVRAAPFGAPSRPKPDQRFREGTRLFRILAVADNDDQGRYLTCFAQEEVAA